MSTDGVVAIRVALLHALWSTIQACVSLIVTWLLDNIMFVSATRMLQLFSRNPACSLRCLSKKGLGTSVGETGRWCLIMRSFSCVHSSQRAAHPKRLITRSMQLNGDMNYRIDQRRDAVAAAIQANDLDSLQIHDQLLKEMKHNRAFRLRAFCEGPLTFPPTYKYDRNSDVFDTSEKRRVPAWCDRVLWRSRESERVVLMGYRRWEVNVSDHRPVSAVLRVTVKRVNGEAREKERRALAGWWHAMEMALLEDARKFYLAQAVV